MPTPTPTATPTPAPNEDPVADFTYSRKGRSKNVDLDGRRSSDADGSIVKYEWDTDGDRVYELTGEQTRAQILSGTVVVLRVTDDDGATDTISKTV